MVKYNLDQIPQEIIQAADKDFDIEAVDMLDELDFYKVYRAGVIYGQNSSKLSWISVKDSLPKQDEEVIVLRDELNTSYFYKISFAHIVDKTVCRDYNGWNVPDVVYWFPMPKIPKTGD